MASGDWRPRSSSGRRDSGSWPTCTIQKDKEREMDLTAFAAKAEPLGVLGVVVSKDG